MRPILVGFCSVSLACLFTVCFDVSPGLAVSNIDGVWSALDPDAQAPSGRREYSAVYDRVQHRYVVFAGFTNEQGGGYFLFNEVWTLTLGDAPAWSALTIPGSVPGERHSPQWGYDPARNRLLVFGGYGRHYPESPDYEYLNDVWELTLDSSPEWNEIVPSGTPPTGRLAGAAVFDMLHQRFVGFGGTAGLPTDTWQLDLRDEPAWSTIETNGVEPLGSYGMTSIFDAAHNRMIIFGGSLTEDYFGTHNDTWELDLKPDIPVWRQLNPSGDLPVARRSLTSLFDPRRNRMVIFGGWDGTPNEFAFLNETWALSLDASDGQWMQLSPDGDVPGVRATMAATYDPQSDRMVLFGGWSGTHVLDDTQFLTWDDAGQAASVTSNAEAGAGSVLLEVDTENTVSPIGAVFRRESGTEWTSIGTFVADALGHASFQDNNVTPGVEYGYKVIVSSEVGDEFLGEVWVNTSPTGVGNTPNAALALQVWPNPANGSFAVSFQPVSDAAARVEMFDVRGQRVLVREINTVGRGAARLDIGNAKDHPSGVYYLRLTQSGRATTSRLVLVR